MPGTVESAGVLALRSPESGRETGEKTILGDRIVLQSNAFFSGEEKTTEVIYSFFFFKGFFILCFGMLLDSKVSVFISLFISFF